MENSAYLNSSLLSNAEIPLPIDPSERICVRLQNISFSFSFNSHVVTSQSGSLFLTSHRVVFVPLPSNFTSFAVPLEKILSVKKDGIKIACENGVMGLVLLKGALIDSFYIPELKRVLSDIVIEVVDESSDSDVPLYCQLHT